MQRYKLSDKNLRGFLARAEDKIHMAIIIRGSTKCFICGAVIEDGQPARSFSHFIQNELDPLSVFNDGAFHSECFRSHPLSAKAEQLLQEMSRRLSPANRLCVVCNRALNNPDDYFVIGHLTENAGSPVHHYNYTRAHASCLPAWRQLRRAYDLIKELRSSPTWRGQALDPILLQLEKAIQDSDPTDSATDLTVTN